MGRTLDDADCSNCSERSRLGLCCCPIPPRVRQSIREAFGEALTPCFKPSAEQGGTLSSACEAARILTGFVCLYCQQRQEHPSRRQRQIMPMPSRDADAIRGGEEQAGRAWGWRELGLLRTWEGRGGDGENLIRKWQNAVGLQQICVVWSTEKHALLHKRP